MAFNSKKISLITAGATAMVCSRLFFFFLDDAEGPNSLVVAGLALAIFLLSLIAYVLGDSEMNVVKRISVAVCIQILSLICLYFFVK